MCYRRNNVSFSLCILYKAYIFFLLSRLVSFARFLQLFSSIVLVFIILSSLLLLYMFLSFTSSLVCLFHFSLFCYMKFEIDSINILHSLTLIAPFPTLCSFSLSASSKLHCKSQLMLIDWSLLLLWLLYCPCFTCNCVPGYVLMFLFIYDLFHNCVK